MRLWLAWSVVLCAAACRKDEAATGATSGSGAPPTAASSPSGTRTGTGAGASPQEPATDPGDFTLEEATQGLEGEGSLRAEIETPKGTIRCDLFPEHAPRTVASFVGLARGVRPWKDPKTGQWVTGQPFFDGLAFHRVIPGFMIQGGDPLSRSYGDPAIGTGDPGYELPDEIVPELRFDRPGRLAMANAGPNTAGSQFFITEKEVRRLDGGYTIFGQCADLDVVKQIARVPVDHPEHNKPLEPLTMKVRIARGPGGATAK